MKRILDIVAAAAGLLLLLPVLAAAALAIFLDDRHAPFYAGARVAQGGSSIFPMLKFRSMIPNAWKSGVSSTAAGDMRITRAGRWLRRFKLDELPQLWNVLRGDMSLTGPRPQVPAEASQYTAAERKIFAVRPGITDLASIVFADEGDILRGAADPDLLYNQIIRPWKSRLALLYVEHACISLDLAILVLTFVNICSRQTALNGVCRILARWNVDPLLVQVASRTVPLAAWPPPGATEIVSRYTTA